MNAVYRVGVFQETSKAWDEMVAKSPYLSLLQTWAFGEAKQASGGWRVERIVLTNNNQDPVAAVQVMVKTKFLKSIGLAWVNRGPVFLQQSPPTATQIALALVALRQFYNCDRGLYLRVAPIHHSGEDIAGYSLTDTLGWASAYIDLTREEAELRQSLNGKWRNALVRAERSDISIQNGSSPQAFEQFLDGHRRHLNAMGQESGLAPVFLQTLQHGLPAERKLYCFTASLDGDYLGGVAIVRYGDTAEYLAGHNLPDGRSNNAGQLLLWAAIITMKNLFYIRFDLGGMDNVRTPEGVFRFKQRVGGKPYRLPNELEAGSGPIHGLIRQQVESKRNI